MQGIPPGFRWAVVFALSTVVLLTAGSAHDAVPALPPSTRQHLPEQRQRGLVDRDNAGHDDRQAANQADRVAPEGNPQVGGGHPGEAAAFRRLSLQNENGEVAADGLIDAYRHVQDMRDNQPPDTGDGADITRGAWTWLGPGNIGGRVRAIAINPVTPSTMLAGGVAGGIWRTLNTGATWSPVDDFMANLAVSSIVYTPGAPDVVYAGTGEGFFNDDSIRGAGVFKSIDGGTTWSQLASTTSAQWYYVNRLAVSPDGATILAATRTGIYRSVNSGTAWTNPLATEMFDIDFHPTDSTKAVASGRNGNAFYTTNGGASWTAASGLPGSGRVEIAYAPSAPDIVYASVDLNGGSFYISIDGGATYTLRFNSLPDYLGSQGWYGNALWVSPTDADFIVVGGIDLYKSTNGGTSWLKISDWMAAPGSAHSDHHMIVASPDFSTNGTVFFGNDGGVYRASDITTVGGGGAANCTSCTSGWTSLNNNLGVTQFYSGAGHADTGTIIGGTQDNGTLKYTPAGGVQGWTTTVGGNGGWSAIDPANANNLYGEDVFMSLHRSLDGGASSDWINGLYWNGSNFVCKAAPYRIGEPGIDGCDPDNYGVSANYVAPFILDPNNANRLLAGGARLWRTNDATTPNTSTTGPSWLAIKPSVGSNISAIAVANLQSEVIWVGHNNGDVYQTTDGTSPAPTWVRRDTTSPSLPNRAVTRIVVHPFNVGVVYVMFGGFSSDNIYRTLDGGNTWAPAVGTGGTGLPAAPIRDLQIHPINFNWLIAATEVGVFTSEDAGGTWLLPHDGPANVSVDDLFVMGRDLVAVTHGRGMYKQTLNSILVPTISPAALVVAPGGTITMSLDNGPGSQLDWAGLYCPPTLPDAAYLDWKYMSNTRTPPTFPRRGATMTFTAPQVFGATCQLRWFANNGFTRLATSTTITITNPLPWITSISPPSVGVGSSWPFSITVTGTGFVTGSVVQVQDLNRETVFISATELTALMAAPGDQGFVGTRSVRVFNPAPDGGLSNAATFTVTAQPPVPTVSSLSPASVAISGPAFQLTVVGAGFIGTSVVRVDGVPRPTTFESATILTAQLTAADRASSGARAITVFTPGPGGGTSGAQTLTVVGPTATASLPTVIAGGVMGFNLINGPGNRFDWVGLYCPTTLADGSYTDWKYMSNTQVPPFSGQTGATIILTAPTVVGTACHLRWFLNNGFTSLATSGTVTVVNPPPSIPSISPANLAAGSAAFTLTVTGTRYVNGSVVRVQGADRPTTFVSPTQLTALIPASDVAVEQTRTVTVFNPAPGGGLSFGATLTVTAPPPAPTLSNISPTSVGAGSAGFPLIATGTGFAGNSVVQVDGVARPTTFGSATSLTAQLTAADRASVGTHAITVFTPAPGGGTSALQTLTVVGPSASVGSTTVAPGGTMTFTLADGPGNRFDWVGLYCPTTLATPAFTDWKFMNNTTVAPVSGVTGGTITFAAPVTMGATCHLRWLLNNGYTVLATSATVTVANPVPTIATISPASVAAGSAAFALTVTGTGFANGAVVRVQGSDRTTTFVSPTQLTAIVQATDVAVEQTRTITVFNPAPGGGLSNGATLTAIAPPPAPTLSSVSPPVVTAGGAAFSLMVTGANFVATSVVRVDGVPRPTTFGSATSLTAQLTAADRASGGARAITVFTPAPGGGTSAAQTLTVVGPTVTVGSPAVAPGGTMTFTLAGGPGNRLDWVGLYCPTTLATASFTNWKFMNNTQVAPVSGVTGATITFAAPTMVGATCHLRWLLNNGYTNLATSPIVTVQAFPGLTINSVSLMEGDSGTSDANFVVSLSPATASTVTVDFATADGTAVAGSDYATTTGTLTFPPGVMSQPIAVPVSGDGANEAQEMFFVNLSNASLNAAIVTAQGTGTIVNDDGPAITVSSSSVAPLGSVTATLANGAGGATDWLALAAVGAAPASYLQWTYVGSGVSARTWPVTMPAAEGQYEFRLFQNNGFTLLASSQAVTVQPPAGCTDTDNDRLCDSVETNTGTFVSATNTGTNPNIADTDGDGLRDGDEVLGTLAGLNLPGLGASPVRKNILLEYDWFDDNSEPGSCIAHTHRPTQAMVDRVAASFAASPATNPDGTTGITVINDYGQGGLLSGGALVAHAANITGGVNSADYASVKSANFAANRAGYFHYVVMGHWYTSSQGSSGQAELPGNDLIVTLGCFVSTNNVANTIMHELGHNLGLRHGGNENCNWKPNYNSVMNYRFQFPGVDVSCNARGSSGEANTLDYSRGTRIPLNESNLDENAGVCGTPPIDWNGSGTITSGLAYELNRDPSDNSIDNSACAAATQTLTDFNDWPSVTHIGLGDSDGQTLFGMFLQLFQEDSVCDNPNFSRVVPLALRPQ